MKFKKKSSDMLNIILDSTEETINKLEVRSKGITQCTARRNELENTSIKEKFRNMKGRITKTGSIRREE